jgi:hypothetical protein
METAVAVLCLGFVYLLPVSEKSNAQIRRQGMKRSLE